MKKFDQLRRDHHTFTYKSFSYLIKDNDLVIEFEFLLHPDIVFKPKLVIPQAGAVSQKLDKPVLNNLIFHLGLIESFSYWKSACAPTIKIQAGSLTSKQQKWWLDLLLKGMGEFFYTNQIDFTLTNFVKLQVKNSKSPNALITTPQNDKYLNLIGGGKDSAVSLEMLKKLNLNQTTLMLNPIKASRDVIKASGVNKSISVKRTIDPLLLNLNKKGYLNGHTPFSAYLAFLSLLLAYLFDFSHIVVANERSSDEENLSYLSQKINHQYSKSFQFEKAFRQYMGKFISPHINYFSLVRPLWEIQISKVFAKYPKYFNSFKSCNKKQEQWCCKCPKCLSTFILLFPFLGQKTIQIFHKDLYKDLSLSSLLKKLTQKDQVKPFECVGAREEIIIGLYLSVSQLDTLPPLLNYAKNNILNSQLNLEKRSKQLLSSWGIDQNLPGSIKKVLKSHIHD